VAERLRVVIRHGDMFGRLGGDEFVVICPETTADAAELVASKLIRAASGKPVSGVDHEVPVSLSVGWAVSAGEEVPRDLLSAADDALYTAKAGGRNRSQGRDEESQARDSGMT
nr:GGDEF domain-containing protein [Candidatus Dormibacteraeota bacterium]